MLYIVATPIGNLDDLSLRQAKTLLSSEIILAEDTRSAKILLSGCFSRFRLLIADHRLPKVISYYKEKEMEKLPLIIDELKKGKIISLISQSGMPQISDPGYLLVKACLNENLPFTIIPGPSAVTTALAFSGFNVKQFIFLGYLVKSSSQKLQLINQLKSLKTIFPDLIFVFFESPKRINKTLQLLKTSNWTGEIAICREMTKKFEEIIRGKVDNLINRNYKGELTVVML